MKLWNFLLFSSVIAINDPFNIFCGNKDCYDILQISRSDATVASIKKAYRKMSLILHPDKNKEVDTTADFLELTKALEVLTDEKQKELYDYYLDHPREYYKVTGRFYYQQLPKSDVRVIILILILLLSILLPAIQYQKWQTAINYLRMASLQNLSLKAGGTKQTLEIHRRAVEKYQEQLQQQQQQLQQEQQKGQETNKTKSKLQNKIKLPSKLSEDVEFIKIIDELVGEVQIEGGYKKPTWEDIFAIKLILFPYHLLLWSKKYYRRRFQTDQMSFDELLIYAEECVGSGTWHTLTELDQDILIEREVWKNPSEILETYLIEKQTEELSKRPNALKRYQRYKKKQS